MSPAEVPRSSRDSGWPGYPAAMRLIAGRRAAHADLVGLRAPDGEELEERGSVRHAEVLEVVDQVVEGASRMVRTAPYSTNAISTHASAPPIDRTVS